MHDGRFKTLKDAVVFMSQAQLGRELSKQDLNDIVAFLKSLDGQTPAIKVKK
jgi:cytochrome c peroxidase